MAIPGRTVDYGSMSNGEYDERIEAEKDRMRKWFFKDLLLHRGEPIRTAQSWQEKRTAEGTCGDFITS